MHILIVYMIKYCRVWVKSQFLRLLHLRLGVGGVDSGGCG
jgi:hypothetical protein